MRQCKDRVRDRCSMHAVSSLLWLSTAFHRSPLLIINSASKIGRVRLFLRHLTSSSCLVHSYIIKPSTPIMSSSSFHRILSSPFSHRDLYGTAHPSETTVTKKKKSKKLKTSARSKTRAASSAPLGSSQKKGRRRQSRVSESTPSSRKASAISLSTSLKQSRSSATASGGLPKVECDSPASLKLRRSLRYKPIPPGPVPARTSAPIRPNPSSSDHDPSTKRPDTASRLFLKFNSPVEKQPPSLRSSLSMRLNVCRATTTASFPSFSSRVFTTSVGGRGAKNLTIEDVARGLGRKQFRNIIVMSGAGVSTASGIIDFRTPGTGLYDNLQRYRVPEPTAIFDITYFAHHPKPFLSLARELYPGQYSPNPVHWFVRLLQDKGLLLRNYTQNIDGLERTAGIKPYKLVEAHGSFSTASCMLCHTTHDPELVKAQIMADKVPMCKQRMCSGLVKPDVVFFGEDLPNRFYTLRHLDFSQCDLLIIMGTSLEVEPFASLATLTKFNVPRVLINREVVGLFKHQSRRVGDFVVTGDLVEQVRQLAKLAGWQKELDDLHISYKERIEKMSQSTTEAAGDVNTEPKRCVTSSGQVSSQPPNLHHPPAVLAARGTTSEPAVVVVHKPVPVTRPTAVSSSSSTSSISSTLTSSSSSSSSSLTDDSKTNRNTTRAEQQLITGISKLTLR